MTLRLVYWLQLTYNQRIGYGVYFTLVYCVIKNVSYICTRFSGD